MVIYYIKDNEDIKGCKKEEFLISVLKDYYLYHAGHNDYNDYFCAEHLLTISRTDRGKPYLEEFPDIRFSVTHTENRWLCAVSFFDVGIDCELTERELPRYESIAKRYFCCTEGMLVSDKGKRTFLKIWVRKEAYLKYTGGGLGDGLSSICTVKGEKILNSISGEDCVFTELSIEDDMMTVICSLPEEINRGILLKTCDESRESSNSFIWNTRFITGG